MLSRSIFLFIVSLFIVPEGPGTFALDEHCAKWFEVSGVEKGEACMNRCLRISVGMGTFDCPKQCEQLCGKQSKGGLILLSLSQVYPGLTERERQLAAKHPVEMLKAYRLSWKAEALCEELYQPTRKNDESDACRHFVWAALLNGSLGKAFAEKVLDAHEAEPSQAKAERAMDLANNRRALLVASTLADSKELSDKALLDLFKKELKAGRLIVLKPRKK